MTSGDIKHKLEDEYGFDNPQVVSFEVRGAYYVVGKKSDDLPNINGFEGVDDPSLAE